MIIKENKFKSFVIITLGIFLIIAAIYLFFEYIFACLLPFFLAFTVTLTTHKAVLFLQFKFKFKRKFAVFSISSVIFILICTILYLLTSRLFNELAVLSEYLTEERINLFITDITKKLTDFGYKLFPGIMSKLSPSISDISKNIDNLATTAVTVILPYIGKTAAAFISAFPSLFVFSAVFILTLFYSACDYEKMVSFIKNQLNAKQLKFVIELKNQLLKTVLSTLKAYTLLILLTFVQLLTGFIIAGIKSPALLAVIISFIDILPVLGTGTVLIPWSILFFLSGNVKTGLCISILYVIITIVRQIAEPKILGDSLGLHPLITLISMYSGLKLAGIKGLFIFPFAVIIINNLNKKGFIRLYKNADSSK